LKLNSSKSQIKQHLTQILLAEDCGMAEMWESEKVNNRCWNGSFEMNMSLYRWLWKQTKLHTRKK
jgi:hypothetical protein